MDDIHFSENALSTVNELLLGAKEKAERLKVEAQQAVHTQSVLDRLLLYLNRRWYLHILRLLKNESNTFSELRKSNQSIASLLDEISQTSQNQASALLKRFPSRLEEACTRHNLSIDRDSRHPKYRFSAGFFQVEVDDRNGIAKLSDNEGLLDEFPSDPEAIVEAVQREHKRVFDRPFDGTRFLKKLRHHYLEILKKKEKVDGENIPIRSITHRLGKNEKGFRTDEFLIDLSRLVEQGPAEIEGFRFDLQQTKDTKQGMLLHGAAGRGYIGFITFRRN